MNTAEAPIPCATAGATPSAGFATPSRLLGAAVIATSLAGVAGAFRGDTSAINAFLFMHLEVPHITSARIEQTGAVLTLALAIVTVSLRHWLPLIPVAVWLFAEAAARYEVRGQAFSEHVFVTQSLRYLTPVALALLFVAARQARLPRSAPCWLLRVSIAAVFAGHGIEALRANPLFIDLIISTAANLVGVRVSETTATSALEVIGLMDLGIAATTLLRPFPQLLWFAALWAATTAFSRVTANDWDAYPEVLLRSSYVLAPLALALLLANSASSAAPARQATPGT